MDPLSREVADLRRENAALMNDLGIQRRLLESDAVQIRALREKVLAAEEETLSVRALNVGLTERVAVQSEILSRRAEKTARAAAEIIVAQWGEWDSEAGQLAQNEQDV